MLVQTDDSMCIVEIKRRRQIGPDIVDEVREKVRKIRKPRGISVRKGLVYAGELAPSVRRCGYFDALVDVARFLRPSGAPAGADLADR